MPDEIEEENTRREIHDFLHDMRTILSRVSRSGNIATGDFEFVLGQMENRYTNIAQRLPEILCTYHNVIVALNQIDLVDTLHMPELSEGENAAFREFIFECIRADVLRDLHTISDQAAGANAET